MTPSQYVLNLALLAWILSSNLGTRTLTRRRIAIPICIVAVAGWLYLRDLPAVGNDGRLELVGLGVGLVLGVIAALTVRVHREGERILTNAGVAFAAIWVAVVGGRVLFAYGAEHWFGRSIGEFSHTHLITGADAWTASFVIMALAMVVSRLAVTGLRAAQLSGRVVRHDGAAAIYR